VAPPASITNDFKALKGTVKCTSQRSHWAKAGDLAHSCSYRNATVLIHLSSSIWPPSFSCRGAELEELPRGERFENWRSRREESKVLVRRQTIFSTLFDTGLLRGAVSGDRQGALGEGIRVLGTSVGALDCAPIAHSRVRGDGPRSQKHRRATPPPPRRSTKGVLLANQRALEGR